MTDWEMKVHNFMCLNKFVKKGEIVFTGSSLCELFRSMRCCKTWSRASACTTAASAAT